MARAPRNIVPDICYHVLNRGNNRTRIFHKQQDYRAFLDILAEALTRYEVDLFSWCLMPNHWHLVLRPRREGALSEFVRWMTVTHVRRYYEHYEDKSGHLYQGRFKAFAVEEDLHFLTLVRYVEANAKRAGLVEQSKDWQWSSYHQRLTGMKGPPMSPWPVDRPSGWDKLVDEDLTEEMNETIKLSFLRERPLGSDKWVRRMAEKLGLTQAIRSLGRPPKPLAQLSPRQRRRRALKGGQNGT